MTEGNITYEAAVMAIPTETTNSLWEQCLCAMETELTAIAALLALETEKTGVLIAGRTADLDEMVNNEQALAHNLAQAEQQRLAVHAELAAAVNAAPAALTMDGLTAAAPAHLHPRLAAVGNRYRELIGLLQNKSNQNRELIQGALAYFDFVAQIRGGTQTASPVYSADGAIRAKVPVRAARYLDGQT